MKNSVCNRDRSLIQHRLLGPIWLILLVANLGAPQRGVSQTPESQKTISQQGIPEELKELIDAGQVKVVYDSDPEFEKIGRGWADFHWEIQRKYEFRTLQKKPREFHVTITKIDWEIRLTHLIRIPSSFRSPAIWTSTLMRHEFDHVAVSLDPRPRMLMEHFLKHVPTIRHTLRADESASNELALMLINHHIDERLKAVQEVMKLNNRQADRVSQHGVIPIPKRAEFFESLYSKENLADCRLPYVDEVLKLLETREYQQASRSFLPLDPTAAWPR